MAKGKKISRQSIDSKRKHRRLDLAIRTPTEINGELR